MQNLDPKTIQLIQISENAIARVHDEILTRYIIETLLTKGNVSIEETQFFNELSKKIITESSHLFIPNLEKLTESLIVNLEEEAKVLVDPETGDKFVYYPDTGELVPATEEDVAGLEAGENTEGEAEGEAEAVDNPDEPDTEENQENDKKEIEPAAQVSEDDVDVSASCSAKKEIKESEEVQESTKTEEKKELNENELLVKQLLSTLKEL